MKIRNIIIAILAFQLPALYTQAQTHEKVHMNLNYNLGFPVGSFNNDLVQDASSRGFTANVLYSLTPKWSVGLGVGYQDYYQKQGRQLYKYGESKDISAVVTNSIQLIPIMAKVQFSPLGASGSVLRPYASLAAGAHFINNDQYLGQFANGNASTGFVAEGGLGMRIALGKSRDVGIDIGGTYNYAPYNKFNYSDLNSVNVHAGVYFPLK